MRLHLVVLPLACAAALLHSGNARAVLGGAVATIHQDQARVAGTRRESAAASVRMHEITAADGSRIREYVSPSGVVFAVAWNTRFKPRLEDLLGEHHAAYSAAASEALKQPGIKRNVVLRRGDLVVHSASHLNSFVGKAYVVSLVPVGVDVDALR